MNLVELKWHQLKTGLAGWMFEDETISALVAIAAIEARAKQDPYTTALFRFNSA